MSFDLYYKLSKNQEDRENGSSDLKIGIKFCRPLKQITM